MNVFSERCAAAQRLMSASAIHAILVGASADMRYLSGYAAHPTERATLFVVPRHGDPFMVIPSFESPRLGPNPWFPVCPWRETEDPIELVTQRLGTQAPLHLAMGDRTWAGFLLRLQAALPTARWTSATPLLRQLRMIKRPDEMAALRQAGAAVDDVFRTLLGLRWTGQSERQIADIIAAAMRDRGCEEVDFTIVASGPNGASGHHVACDRIIEHGDTVVLDYGGPFGGGYYADITRTVVVGNPSPEVRTVYDTVRAAQEAGVQAVRPGIACQDVDAAARQVITKAGYGEFFNHRTGHGIGLDDHEEPYIVAGNDLPLAPGMAFSVEPGIYLPGRFGVRIEDIVICQQEGAERLNHCTRDLQVVH